LLTRSFENICKLSSMAKPKYIGIALFYLHRLFRRKAEQLLFLSTRKQILFWERTIKSRSWPYLSEMPEDTIVSLLRHYLICSNQTIDFSG
jgi:hypothetical protein